MPSASEIIANKGLVKGFLKPVFYDEYSSSSALTTGDFEKVRDGYACARCLAEFVMYLVKCPVCGHERDLAADLEAPNREHVAYLEEKRDTDGMDTGVPAGFDEFMRSVEQNPDIDHIPLSKLKKRRRR